MSGELRYVSIDEFVNKCGKRLSTIKRRHDDIPGLLYENGEFTILEGTRYPCDLHRYQIKDSADKRYVLLKTISKEEYICAKDLRVYERQFEGFLSDLLQAGLIRPNGMSNQFGANEYDCTPDGDKVLANAKESAKTRIAELVGTAMGSAAGAYASSTLGA